MSGYANQWKFRSTEGDIHNTFYYFNKGILKCNDISEQCIDVLLYYESLGIEVYGLVCDGGSKTERFSNKIVQAFDLGNQTIDMKSVSMIYSYDNARRIYF